MEEWTATLTAKLNSRSTKHLKTNKVTAASSSELVDLVRNYNFLQLQPRDNYTKDYAKQYYCTFKFYIQQTISICTFKIIKCLMF